MYRRVYRKGVIHRVHREHRGKNKYLYKESRKLRKAGIF
jgi:hypothetical protein